MGSIHVKGRTDPVMITRRRAKDGRLSLRLAK
jgi:hypothetical protein